MVSASAFSHVTPISNVPSQGIATLQTSSSSPISQEANTANDSVQEHKPIINPVQQPVRPGGHGSFRSNLSQFQLMNSTISGEATLIGLPNIGATPLQAYISNIIWSGVTSTPSVTTSLSRPGQPIGTQQTVQSTALGSFGSSTSIDSRNSNIAASSSQPNLSMGQQAGVSTPGVTDNSAQPPLPNYVKIWEVKFSVCIYIDLAHVMLCGHVSV